MKLLLTPSSLRGTVTVPPSKSLLHRELICRFLAGQVTELPLHAAQDVLATYRGLACLTAPAPLVDCGDSGSTLRFLLPLFMALGRTDAVFTGSDRLLSRPIPGDLGLRRTEQGLAQGMTAALRQSRRQPQCPPSFGLVVLHWPLRGRSRQHQMPDDRRGNQLRMAERQGAGLIKYQLADGLSLL